jgi:hypothetical protein
MIQIKPKSNYEPSGTGRQVHRSEILKGYPIWNRVLYVFYIQKHYEIRASAGAGAGVIAGLRLGASGGRIGSHNRYGAGCVGRGCRGRSGNDQQLFHRL